MLVQEELIAAVKAKAAADAGTEGVLMYGSFTQNAGDEFSDVEFYLFVADTVFEALDTAGWIAGVAPVYTCFFNQYGTQVAIFKSLVRGEFHFLPASEMGVIESFAPVGWVPDIDAMCLYDKTGALRRYLEDLQVNASAVRRDSAESIEYVFNNCVNLILMGANVLQRGEIARALDILTQAQSFYLQLVRLDEGQTHHWLNPLKALEREISTPAYQRFALCATALHEVQMEWAYFELGRNLKDIIEKLRKKLEFSYNREMLDILIETKLKMC